jgi:hypothetical protein
MYHMYIHMFNIYIIYINLICCKFMNLKPIDKFGKTLLKFGLNTMKLFDLCYFCY